MALHVIKGWEILGTGRRGIRVGFIITRRKWPGWIRHESLKKCRKKNDVKLYSTPSNRSKMGIRIWAQILCEFLPRKYVELFLPPPGTSILSKKWCRVLKVLGHKPQQQVNLYFMSGKAKCTLEKIMNNRTLLRRIRLCVFRDCKRL